jgi:hypothetical protein
MTNEQAGKQCEGCRWRAFLDFAHRPCCAHKEKVEFYKWGGVLWRTECDKSNPNNDCPYFEEVTA